MIYHIDQFPAPTCYLGGTLYRNIHIDGFYAELDPGEDPSALPDGLNGWRPVSHNRASGPAPIRIHSRCLLTDDKPDPGAFWRHERSGWSSVPYSAIAKSRPAERLRGVGRAAWKLIQLRHRDDAEVSLELSEAHGREWLTVSRLDEATPVAEFVIS